MSHSSSTPAPLPSNRSFGLLFSSAFVALGVHAHFFKASPSAHAWIWGLAGAVVALVTLVSPHWLTPFNRAWFRLGALLGKVVNPVVFGIMFFGLITPIGRVARWLGRDALRLQPRKVDSHWIDRQPPGPRPDSFNNPF